MARRVRPRLGQLIIDSCCYVGSICTITNTPQMTAMTQTGTKRKNQIGKCVANCEREKEGDACAQKTPLDSRKTMLRRINKKKRTPNHYVGIVDAAPNIELHATPIFLS